MRRVKQQQIYLKAEQNRGSGFCRAEPGVRSARRKGEWEATDLSKYSSIR